MNLDHYKYIYLIGVGGVGMSALARYFNSHQKKVYGYDQVRSILCKELEKEGVRIHYKQGAKYIPQEIKEVCLDDLLVVYTPAVPFGSFEICYFLEKGIQLYKRSEILGAISKDSFTIAVAGTHGKTTTSTMLAHILYKSGKDVTAFLGGISKDYNTNLLLSNSEDILIVEADEYDRSFLQLYADIAVITSLDADHLDIYEDESDLQAAFMQFASQVKEEGILLVENSIKIDFPTPKNGVKLKYSAIQKADCYADNIKMQNGNMLFDVRVVDVISDDLCEQKKDSLELQLPGVYNVSNAIAALSVAYYLGLSFQEISDNLATFKGIKRRFDKHIDNEKVVYIDDYAHHPRELTAIIDTAKKMYPARELTVIFQPHLFTRTQNFAKEFAESLSRADDLVLLDIYPAREQPIIGVNSEMLLSLCSNAIKEACSSNEILSILKEKDIDVLLTLGAGDIGDLVRPIKQMLN
tara:strand:+ start:4271 stop:5671 length:1401 start_codon:yes stop_codon:yes gene_type:complete